jgi:tRNA-intron endonuclease
MKNKIEIMQSGNRFLSASPQSITLQKSRRFGEFKNKKVIYSKFEALYLQEKNRAILKKPIKLKKSEHKEYLIYKDLRDKTMIPKTALKFGADLRVYDKPSSSHARWLVYVLDEKDKIKIKDLISKTRIAHSTKKELLIAVVDDEEDITYYNLNWKKM